MPKNRDQKIGLNGSVQKWNRCRVHRTGQRVIHVCLFPVWVLRSSVLAACAVPCGPRSAALCVGRSCGALWFGLYKILFYVEAYVHESVIFFANTSFVWAPHSLPSSHTRLRNIFPPLTPPVLQYIPYNIVNDNIV